MADKRFWTEIAAEQKSLTDNKKLIAICEKVEPLLTDLFGKKSYVPLADVKAVLATLERDNMSRPEKTLIQTISDQGTRYYHEYYKQVRADRNKAAQAFAKEQPTPTPTVKANATAKSATAKSATAKSATAKSATAKSDSGEPKVPTEKGRSHHAKTSKVETRKETAAEKAADKIKADSKVTGPAPITKATEVKTSAPAAVVTK